MRKTTTLFVGMDVHKDSITVAYAEEDRGAELRERGRERAPSRTVSSIRMLGGSALRVT